MSLLHRWRLNRSTCRIRYSRSEEDIRRAVVTMIQKTRNLVEGADAAPLAAAVRLGDTSAGKRTAMVCSGGNLGLEHLRETLELFGSGRTVCRTHAPRALLRNLPTLAHSHWPFSYRSVERARRHQAWRIECSHEQDWVPFRTCRPHSARSARLPEEGADPHTRATGGTDRTSGGAQ